MPLTRMLVGTALVTILFVLSDQVPADDLLNPTSSHGSARTHGLANYRQVSPPGAVGPRIDCGGQPEADSDFRTLAERGIRVVVSVDGARPDTVAAARHGIRTIHWPVGYDGIDEDAIAALTRIVNEIDTPIYVHCHHGRHRGPAAAAIASFAAGQIDAAQAMDVLRGAGTDPRYAGLWRDVQHFRPLAKDHPLPELVESSPVEPIVLEMLKLDVALENLRAATDPTKQLMQLVLLSEGYRESARHVAVVHPQLRDQLGESELEVNRFIDTLRSGANVGLTEMADQLKESCTRCHDQFRN